jgi:hypothetical protein
VSFAEAACVTDRGVQMAHFILTFIILFVTAFTTYDVLILSFTCAAAFITVIYVPASFILSLRNSTNRFDHAGGEVAFLVVQEITWLGMLVFPV